MPTGPTINRFNSKQDYSTPWEFIRAVEKKFGKLDIDLAGTERNRKAPRVITPRMNSFKIDWSEHLTGIKENPLGWLNPPFNNIEPWAHKCRDQSRLYGFRTLFLVPASIGSEWFANYVHRWAMVFALSPRISFDGESPYPKDLMLAYYNCGVNGFDTWRWKQ